MIIDCPSQQAWEECDWTPANHPLLDPAFETGLRLIPFPYERLPAIVIDKATGQEVRRLACTAYEEQNMICVTSDDDFGIYGYCPWCGGLKRRWVSLEFYLQKIRY